MNNDNLLAAVAAYLVAEDGEKELAKEGIRSILDGSDAAPAVKKSEDDRERVIRKMMVELGVPCHLKGHALLVCAIGIVLDDPAAAGAITKVLYPELARRFDDTPPRVERAIRHAIEVMFIRGEYKTLNKYFGNTICADKGKPTNAECIARLAEVARIGL